MNNTEQNADLHVQLWAFLGPLVALGAAFTLLVKGSSFGLHLSCMLLLGIIFSWKWKVRGLVASAIFLVLLIGYHYLEIPPAERLWHVGMGTAIGMSFLITALAFQEVELLIGGMHKESTGRLKSLLHLDEKLELTTRRLEGEKAAALSQLQEIQKKLQTYENLVSIAKDEIIAGEKMQEKMQLEICEARLSLNRLQEQVEFAAANIDVAETPSIKVEGHNWQSMYTQLRGQFYEKSEELDTTRKELFRAEERVLSHTREKDLNKLDRTAEELELERCLFEIEEERDRLFAETEQLQEIITMLTKSRS